MTVVLVLTGLAVLAYMAACTISGMRPAEVEIADFVPEVGPLVRNFSDPIDVVRSAYVTAVSTVPGMSVAHHDQQSILIDMKPTVLVMEGSFGMLLLVSFGRAKDGTSVTVEAQPKVSFAWSVNLNAACLHAERSLRMKAKQAGLDEIVTRL